MTEEGLLGISRPCIDRRSLVYPCRMIDWVGYGWMAGEATGPSPFFADLTIEVPRGDVVAAAAFTGFSMGVWEHRPGTAAVCLREYAHYDSSGKAKVVDVPPDPANGVFAIPDCFFVRFRMTVQQGHAFARGLVFRLVAGDAGAAGAFPGWSVRDYRITVGGEASGTHRVMTLARGTRLPTGAILDRASGEAARFFGVRRRQVTVTARRVRRGTGRMGPTAPRLA
jgi:hypothetical protein